MNPRERTYVKFLVEADRISVVQKLGIDWENRVGKQGGTSTNAPRFAHIFLSSCIFQNTIHHVPGKDHSRFSILPIT